MNPQRRKILSLFCVVAVFYLAYWLVATAKEVLAWQNVSLFGKLIALIYNACVAAFFWCFDPFALAFIVFMAILFYRAKTQKPEEQCAPNAALEPTAAPSVSGRSSKPKADDGSAFASGGGGSARG